jgi:hypothetical protein
MDYNEGELTQEDYNLFIKSLKNKENVSFLLKKLINNKKLGVLLEDFFYAIRSEKTKLTVEESINFFLSLEQISEELSHKSFPFSLSEFSYTNEIMLEIIIKLRLEKDVRKILNFLIKDQINWALPLFVINSIERRIKRKELGEIITEIFIKEKIKKTIAINSEKDFDKIITYNQNVLGYLLFFISLWNDKKVNRRLDSYLKKNSKFMNFIESIKIPTVSYGPDGPREISNEVSLTQLDQIYGVKRTEQRLIQINSKKSEELLNILRTSKYDKD